MPDSTRRIRRVSRLEEPSLTAEDFTIEGSPLVDGINPFDEEELLPPMLQQDVFTTRFIDGPETENGEGRFITYVMSNDSQVVRMVPYDDNEFPETLGEWEELYGEDAPVVQETPVEVTTLYRTYIGDIRNMAGERVRAVEYAMSNNTIETRLFPMEDTLIPSTLLEWERLYRHRIAVEHPTRNVLFKSKAPTKTYKDTDLITLYNESTKCKVGDCIYIDNLGWFKKDDSRLQKDYNVPERYVVVDEVLSRQVYGHLGIIFKGINEDGGLIDPVYTLYTDHNYALPRVITQDTSRNKISQYAYIPLEMLKNETFNKFYVEDMNKGTFHKKDEVLVKNLAKHPKTQYRKYKHYNKFSESVRDKPNTFIKMLGKRYTFGLEIETSSGFLPKYLDNIIYYDAVHDGSLRDSDGHTFGKRNKS